VQRLWPRERYSLEVLEYQPRRVHAAASHCLAPGTALSLSGEEQHHRQWHILREALRRGSRQSIVMLEALKPLNRERGSKVLWFGGLVGVPAAPFIFVSCILDEGGPKAAVSARHSESYNSDRVPSGTHLEKTANTERGG